MIYFYNLLLLYRFRLIKSEGIQSKRSGGISCDNTWALKTSDVGIWIYTYSKITKRIVTYWDTTTTGPYSHLWRHLSTMFISSTRELVEVGTLWPMGQQVSWKSCTVLAGAFTPAISSVNETIWKRNRVTEMVVRGKCRQQGTLNLIWKVYNNF